MGHIERIAQGTLAAGAALAMSVAPAYAAGETGTASPAAPAAASAPASEVSVLAVPTGCSAWIDWYAGRGRGHLNCVGSGRDVRVTVACGDGSIKRSATGYQYARAECPTGLGGVRVSGAYIS
ncbi:hypothetical protein [Streptomyces thermolilacinus]|uniref:Uncharacterized protein n=1 Tax=Streptomyces thermolilacinus SPC6 TaxID=1306406 RepID=A0A1D3DV19_9ACTN|nr:hypothetical protein [Streptomyces thermolilacinus]OEJ96163.1 hypothetical protein J116_018520 [Streptomyces thermolilacinus SPC6]